MKKAIILLSLFIFANLIISPVSALNLIEANKINDLTGSSGATANLAGANGAGYDTNNVTLEKMIANIIRMVLAVLGTIFLILMFVAGNDWMQAAGNEEKVKKSISTIRNLILGLCVVLIAYAMASGLGGLISSMLLATPK